MTTPAYEKPADFDAFWQDVLAELAQLPRGPGGGKRFSLRSSDIATVYGVRLTSHRPYRIFGYHERPQQGKGLSPRDYFLPRYGSVTDLVPQGTANGQRRISLLSPSASGASAAPTVPYAASFPASLPTASTTPTPTSTGASSPTAAGPGIPGPAARGGTGRIAAIGTDLALATAALCPRFTHLVSTPVIHHRALGSGPGPTRPTP